MPKIFTSEKQKTGELGEKLAVKYLIKNNFKIIERNYTRKWGEIDIIGEKDNKVYFIEVKSVSKKIKDINNNFLDAYRPEDNMHPWKLKRLSRAIQTYLLSNKSLDDKDWQLDLIVVFLDIENKKAKIKLVKDIIL